MLNCIDNSGATIVECVANLRMKRHGRVGALLLMLLSPVQSAEVHKAIAS